MAERTDDPYDLDRFVKIQAGVYTTALSEIRRGRKSSHWMWHIFPQLAGLGFSAMAQRYAISDLAEAEAYLKHPLLGPRLVECAEAALLVQGRSAYEIFGSPDDLKFRSSATLFAAASPPGCRAAGSAARRAAAAGRTPLPRARGQAHRADRLGGIL